jgi:hypothetical protein
MPPRFGCSTFLCQTLHHRGLTALLAFCAGFLTRAAGSLQRPRAQGAAPPPQTLTPRSGPQPAPHPLTPVRPSSPGLRHSPAQECSHHLPLGAPAWGQDHQRHRIPHSRAPAALAASQRGEVTRRAGSRPRVSRHGGWGLSASHTRHRKRGWLDDRAAKPAVADRSHGRSPPHRSHPPVPTRRRALVAAAAAAPPGAVGGRGDPDSAKLTEGPRARPAVTSAGRRRIVRFSPFSNAPACRAHLWPEKRHPPRSSGASSYSRLPSAEGVIFIECSCHVDSFLETIAP